MWAIAKKEFKQYFLSPIAYIYIGAFLLVCSILFYTGIFTKASVNFATIFSLGAAPLIILVPLLTMRTFSEERKSETEVLLITSPSSVFSIVMGKFLACAFVVLVSIALTFVYYLILLCFGTPYLVPSLVAMLGFVLLAMAYIACGMFISSLTENQMVSAIVSMVIFLLITLLPNVTTAFDFVSISLAFNTFIEGLLSLHDVILLISTIALFLALTMLIIKKRKMVR